MVEYMGLFGEKNILWHNLLIKALYVCVMFFIF